MLQDIKPFVYDNDFRVSMPTPDSYALCYQGDQVLCSLNASNKLIVPRFSDLGIDCESAATTGHFIPYLFTLGENDYFLVGLDGALKIQNLNSDQWHFKTISELNECYPKQNRFALTVGYEYWVWYSTSRYCGRCATPLEPSSKERMLQCPHCGNMVFPKLSPAVIVGITREDGKVLVSTYARNRYKNFALIAGFCEMGETVEQTVKREVFEEVGLNVKNLRYYASQPWPLSQSLLFGFFCELDGDPVITLDKNELASAEWIDRDELLEDNDHSLTRSMMQVLRDGREKDYPLVGDTEHP